ncbi:transmembrane protein 254-like [Physella acuta]|uniref:transmembrane protein 254-like n=1 Tax=Physella acuta TaxID=109671 RepID=UPI0027DD97BD|nr:transmembrane protein 254-like [Physella acuta]
MIFSDSLRLGLCDNLPLTLTGSATTTGQTPIERASTFSPNSIPDFLGPVATLAKHISRYHNFCVLLCLVTVVLHVLEAAYAGKVCYDRGMTSAATAKWVISTFFFGFSSLKLRLLPYKPVRKEA